VALGLLHGTQPDAIVISDDPYRTTRDDFDRFEITNLDDEIDLIESLCEAEVAAVSTWGDSETTETDTGLPAGNVFEDGGTEALLDAVQEAL
jgi:uncharacterized NAD-dependent epimerase/dehydratase family protein